MNNYMKKWLRCAGVRAVRTMAQTAAATIGASTVLSAVDWRVTVSAAVLAGLSTGIAAQALIQRLDKLQK